MIQYNGLRNKLHQYDIAITIILQLYSLLKAGGAGDEPRVAIALPRRRLINNK